MSEPMDYGDDGDHQRDIYRMIEDNCNIQQNLIARNNSIQMPVMELLNSEFSRESKLTQDQQQLQQYARLLYQGDGSLQESTNLLCTQNRGQRSRSTGSYNTRDSTFSSQNQVSPLLTSRYQGGNQFRGNSRSNVYRTAQNPAQQYHGVQRLQNDQKYNNLYKGSRSASQQQQIAQQLQSQSIQPLGIQSQDLQPQGLPMQVIQKFPNSRFIQQFPEAYNQQQNQNIYNNNTLLEPDGNNIKPDLMRLLSLYSTGDLHSLQDTQNLNISPEQSHFSLANFEQHNLNLGSERIQDQLLHESSLQSPADTQKQYQTIYHQQSQRKQPCPQATRSQDPQVETTFFQKQPRNPQAEQPPQTLQPYYQQKSIPSGGGLLEETNHEVPNGPFSAFFMKKKPPNSLGYTPHYKIMGNSSWFAIPNSSFSNYIIPVLPRPKHPPI